MRAVFRDMSEDSEVRIAAYLGLMRCPSHQEVGLVRDALEREQVNQGEYADWRAGGSSGPAGVGTCDGVRIGELSTIL